MPPVDPQCAALGIPEHLHSCGRPEDQHFRNTEKLYRRNRLNDRKIKTAITFRQMSVNREKYCPSPGDALINSQEGGPTQDTGFGVVSFTAGDVRALAFTDESAGAVRTCAAVVLHDIAREPCNFSHSLVHGAMNGIELAPEADLPKTARKELRHQIYKSVVTEIPAERAGDFLEEGSWQ